MSLARHGDLVHFTKCRSMFYPTTSSSSMALSFSDVAKFAGAKNAIYDDFLEETIESVDILPTSNSNSDTTPLFTHTHNFYLYFLTQESDTLDNLTRILAVMSSPLKCDIVTTLPTSAFYFAIIHFDSWVQNKRGLRRKRLTS